VKTTVAYALVRAAPTLVSSLRRSATPLALTAHH